MRTRTKRAMWPLLLVGLVCLSLGASASTKALDQYYTAPDPSFSWQLVAKTPGPSGGTLYQLSFTSQVWKETRWQHRLFVLVPDGALEGNAALLFITGSGSGKTEIPLMAQLAQKASAPVAVLFDVPNQPLFGGLKEDALISLTFDKFFETGDPTWPVLLPMTKSAVRAMDVFTEFSQKHLGYTIDDFVVTGGSKRGWTTWLAAAVDARICAIAPIAYDNLNLHAQMEHQLKSFGSYSLQISDYTVRGLQAALTTEQGRRLVEIVDPYAYRDRYTLPKLIIRGSNDPYWPTDAMTLYIDDLPGDTWIHNDPNGSHDLTNYERVLTTLSAFFVAYTRGPKLAPVKWNVTESASDFRLEVVSPEPAVAFNLWTAVAPSRDFRNATWSCRSVGPGGSHTFQVTRLNTSHQAIYGEVILRVNGLEMAFDTPIFIVDPRM